MSATDWAEDGRTVAARKSLDSVAGLFEQCNDLQALGELYLALCRTVEASVLAFGHVDRLALLDTYRGMYLERREALDPITG